MTKEKKENKEDHSQRMLALFYSLILLLSPDKAAQFNKIFKIKQPVRMKLLPDHSKLSQPEQEIS